MIRIWAKKCKNSGLKNEQLTKNVAFYHPNRCFECFHSRPYLDTFVCLFPFKFSVLSHFSPCKLSLSFHFMQFYLHFHTKSRILAKVVFLYQFWDQLSTFWLFYYFKLSSYRPSILTLSVFVPILVPFLYILALFLTLNSAVLHLTF